MSELTAISAGSVRVPRLVSAAGGTAAAISSAIEGVPAGAPSEVADAKPEAVRIAAEGEGSVVGSSAIRSCSSCDGSRSRRVSSRSRASAPCARGTPQAVTAKDLARGRCARPPTRRSIADVAAGLPPPSAAS
eukprot:1063992-Prymnesium_polylepis.1